MKRKTRLVLIGLVLSILIGGGLVGTPPSRADLACELQLANDFWAADSQYTTTFRSWYLGKPTTCDAQCSPQCSSLTGSAHTTCMNNCINSCNSTRFSAFQGAQTNLMTVAGRDCPLDSPNFCDGAQAAAANCTSTRNSRMANPVRNPDGSLDITWASMVMESYSACMEVSGIDQCQ